MCACALVFDVFWDIRVGFPFIEIVCISPLEVAREIKKITKLLYVRYPSLN